MYGTVASAFSPVPYSVIITLFKPENYDWADFRKEKLGFEVQRTDSISRRSIDEVELEASNVHDQPHLKRWGRIAAYFSIATFLGHWVM